jgi:hypothetical protein
MLYVADGPRTRAASRMRSVVPEARPRPPTSWSLSAAAKPWQEEFAATGMSEGLVHISLGIEDWRDLFADFG